ncbi:hypothetical protein D3C80_1391700 [compost metagenome]
MSPPATCNKVVANAGLLVTQEFSCTNHCVAVWVSSRRAVLWPENKLIRRLSQEANNFWMSPSKLSPLTVTKCCAAPPTWLACSFSVPAGAILCAAVNRSVPETALLFKAAPTDCTVIPYWLLASASTSAIRSNWSAGRLKAFCTAVIASTVSLTPLSVAFDSLSAAGDAPMISLAPNPFLASAVCAWIVLSGEVPDWPILRAC